MGLWTKKLTPESARPPRHWGSCVLENTTYLHKAETPQSWDLDFIVDYPFCPMNMNPKYSVLKAHQAAGEISHVHSAPSSAFVGKAMSPT